MPADRIGADSPLVRSLAGEIAEALGVFLRGGAPAAIDLRGLPMSEADRAALESWLGEGEVKATLDVAGRSEVKETRFAGVWWVRHFGAGDHVAAERIEIVSVPAILVADAADMAVALRRLNEELDFPEVMPSKEVAEHV